MKTVGIFGAGIAGLSAAHELANAGFNLVRVRVLAQIFQRQEFQDF